MSLVQSDDGPDGPVSRSLPSYRAVLAVDTVGFSKQLDRHMAMLSADIPDLLEQAFETAGLLPIWARRRFPQATGDGYVCGFLPEDVPFVIHPILDHLNAALAAHDARLRAHNRDLRLRLRVSLNLGPVHDSDDERSDRIGTTTNDAFRLLDATVIKHVMATANPDVTLMAVILSERVFRDVVRPGWTGLHADRCEPVTAEVEAKGFVQPAWLYVPTPSLSDPKTARPVAADLSGSTPVHGSGPMTKIQGDVGQAITADRVYGGIRQDIGKSGGEESQR